MTAALPSVLALRGAVRLLVAGLLIIGAEAWAQQSTKVHRVAFVATTSPIAELKTTNPAARGFARGMQDRGYVEGRNLVIEWRTAEGRLDRVPEILREVAGIPVDVIVTVFNPITRAAKDMTRTIPIVMASSTNPVEEGLVQSLARPGGNVTGQVTDPSSELFAKRMQLLRDLVPNLSEVVAFGQAQVPAADHEALEAAARSMGVRIRHVIPQDGRYAEALASVARKTPDALIVMQSPTNYAHRAMITAFAAAHRLPAIYPSRDYALAGGLLAYGVDIGELFHDAAAYVVRILEGADPAALPVQRPSKLKLVINLKTANALALNIPAHFLLRAEEVIQ